MEIAARRHDAFFEIVDLRDYPMPFFEEAGSPFYVPPSNDMARKWGEKIDSLNAKVDRLNKPD